MKESRHILFSLMLFLLLASQMQARRVHISGMVTDQDGNPVELATVNEAGYLASGTTNLKGRYSISLEYRDTIELVFRMIGHETRRHVLINPADSTILHVTLPVNGYSLQGVEVKGQKIQSGQMQDIGAGSLRLQPVGGGGAVESLIATQAGVSSRNEMSSQYNVRGGNFDENSIYVNGIEIMRPQLVRAGEQEGLSFINPDMVESIRFSTGGFDAGYSDRSSSVLDITYKTPRQTEVSANANLMGTSVYAGTGNDRFSIMTSLRYKTTRNLLGTLDTSGEYSPDYLDLQACAEWNVTDRFTLSFLGNTADNRYRFTPSTRTTKFGTIEDPKVFTMYFDGWEKDRFRTMTGALSASYDINSKNNISLSLSAFDSNESETFDINGEYWIDGNDQASRFDIGGHRRHARNYLDMNTRTIHLGGNHQLAGNTLKWGAESRIERIYDNINEWEMRDSAGYVIPSSPDGSILASYALKSSVSMNSLRSSAFIQDTWRINTGSGIFALNAGIRGTYWNWNDEFIFSPRLSVGFIPSKNDAFTFRLATGVYYQSPFYKEFRDTGSDSTDGGAIILNKDIRSQRSLQFVAGADYVFYMFDRPFKFTGELYYKKLSNLIPYYIDNVRLVYSATNSSHGYAAGIDTKLFGEFVPGTDSWITLSLMRTRQEIDGVWLPRPSEQRFNASVFFTDYFPGTDRWQMTLRGVYSDGVPFGPSNTGTGQAVFRSPTYKRVDIGLSYCLFNANRYAYLTGWKRDLNNIWIGIDCLNLLDNNNVASYYWITDAQQVQYAVPNYLTGRQVNLKLLISVGK